MPQEWRHWSWSNVASWDAMPAGTSALDTAGRRASDPAPAGRQPDVFRPRDRRSILTGVLLKFHDPEPAPSPVHQLQQPDSSMFGCRRTAQDSETVQVSLLVEVFHSWPRKRGTGLTACPAASLESVPVPVRHRLFIPCGRKLSAHMRCVEIRRCHVIGRWPCIACLLGLRGCR